MAKKAVKKKSIESTKRFDVKKPSHLIIIVLLVLGIGFVISGQVGVYRDRRLFKQAEAKTEEIYAQIVDTVGEPDKVVRQKSCGRASRKFEQGPLSCNISIQSIFYNKDNSDSWRLVQEVSKLNESSLQKDFLSKIQSSSFDHYKLNEKRQIYFQSLEDQKNLVCEVGYEYPVNNKSAYYNLLMPQSPENLRIGISCGGPAKAEHYPIRD